MSDLDYTSPASTKSVVCKFQTRRGEVTEDERGNHYTYDGILYTDDGDIQINDLIEVDLGGFTGKFLVVGIQPKFAMDGRLTHYEVPLTKETRR